MTTPLMRLYFIVTSLVAADHIIFHDEAAMSNDENTECVCSMELPDTAFPSHMVVFLQDAYVNFTSDTEHEEEKVICNGPFNFLGATILAGVPLALPLLAAHTGLPVTEQLAGGAVGWQQHSAASPNSWERCAWSELVTAIHFRIIEFQDKMKNLTNIVDEIEKKGIKDEADYQKVKDAVNELDKMSKDLSTILNTTDMGIEDLLNKVNNISSMVWQLETFDENNVLATRREIDTLRKQLADCEEAAGNPNLGLPSAGLLRPEIGKCDNKILLNISKPFIVKLNWRGFSYKYGGWGKDFALETKNPGIYWVAPLNTDERLMETYRIYNSYKDLLLYRNQVERSLSQHIGLTWNYINCGQGSGMILYNNSFYYNCYNSRNLCKQNLANNRITRLKVNDAVFNNWFSYNGVNWQDFDFAGDEKGLWITYSTEKSKGKLVIGKVDPETLKILKTWQTSLNKPEVTNTFMICGVLYALKRVSAHKELIFFQYDTNTGKESTVEIIMEKLSDTAQSVSYNPNDHKVYMYNDGYLVTYDILFKYQPPRTRRSVPSYEGALSASGGRRQLAMV
ncbi:olfactomedin-like [Eublepharis macularius]|uniref:Olfactomedin-like n=1 Tax=Eublepharis macularius TaxID=481883 RepID=A0AA97IV01_EUBMA|nr:olfactomedin-like [Eublepharis macularius]